jgi:predicted TIM-barrel fold metal-dependent hydrolase
MVIDCHVHVSACTAAHGLMSDRLLNSIPFRFMRWKFGIPGNDERAERMLEDRLVRTIDETPEIDAAVVLAFDAVYDAEGRADWANTHLYVTNDYAIELAARHRKVLFGASVHPYRKDAVAELERCVAAGAVLLKWLPVTQGIDPADKRCFPFYEALAHFKLPLLSHTGGEKSLPQLNDAVEDPMLLEPALRRGVTVIAAHCGTRSVPFGRDYVPQFMRLAREYEHCYGDTSALNLPARWHAYDAVLNDRVVRQKLIHGSDWPILSMPSPRQVGWGGFFDSMSERNWIRRDVRIKQQLGFERAYWERGARVLRVGETAKNVAGTALQRANVSR